MVGGGDRVTLDRSVSQQVSPLEWCQDCWEDSIYQFSVSVTLSVDGMLYMSVPGTPVNGVCICVYICMCMYVHMKQIKQTGLGQL